jgi:hypothetical protein
MLDPSFKSLGVVKILIGHHNITYFASKYDLKIVILLLMTHFITQNPTIEA